MLLKRNATARRRRAYLCRVCDGTHKKQSAWQVIPNRHEKGRSPFRMKVSCGICTEVTCTATEVTAAATVPSSFTSANVLCLTCEIKSLSWPTCAMPEKFARWGSDRERGG